MFRKSKDKTINISGDFGYLPESAIYFDSACQSLRPQPVIDAMNEYYQQFNSCDKRVKYDWGKEVDEKVSACRAKILKMLKLSEKKYFTSFTLNTTYGLNLILGQLKSNGIKKIITSDIEHNSPFLASQSFAKKHNIPREVLARNDDGSIDIKNADFSDSVVVLNAASNIDGRKLKNIHEVSERIKQQKGIFIIDAAQLMANHHEFLHGVEADAICFSSHKMYGPSLGVIVAKRDLLDRIETAFIGGGMVDDVTRDDYVLSSRTPEHHHTAFEVGLQSYAAIIGLGVAIDWLLAQKKSGATEKLTKQSQKLYDFLKSSSKVHLINQESNSTISFYHEDFGSELLAAALSDQGIMVRSGYFCCHYYLDHVKKYPKLVRFSLGFNTRDSDIEAAIKVLGGVIK